MLNYTGFEKFLCKEPFVQNTPFAGCGTSGGRTSALLAALMPDTVTLMFQNTGKEHPKTLEFVARLQDALGREIVWLEFRPPVTMGLAPRFSRVERVTYETASRKGEPFVAFLETLAAFRAKEKGLPPVVPHPRGRICTAYMKMRVQQRYVDEVLKIDEEYEYYVGLRADEPGRVSRLRSGSSNEGLKLLRTPLADAGITKADVLRFWSQQKFDLEIPEYLGNCTGCFLKDQSDIARVLEDPEEAAFWIGLEERFGKFGQGNGFSAMAEEAPVRKSIRESLHKNEQPVYAGDDPTKAKRFLRLVKDETRRYTEGAAQFSCSCESAELLSSDDAVADDFVSKDQQLTLRWQ